MKEEFRATAASKASLSADREEAIRRMAYTLYEARGRIGGHELEDWLRAEALVAQASAERPGAGPLVVAVDAASALVLPAEPLKAARKARPAAKAAGAAAKKAGTGAPKKAASAKAGSAVTPAGKAAAVVAPARKRAPPKPRTP